MSAMQGTWQTSGFMQLIVRAEGKQISHYLQAPITIFNDSAAEKDVRFSSQENFFTRKRPGTAETAVFTPSHKK